MIMLKLYLSPEANTANHTSRSPVAADPNHLYPHSEDHQHGFYTPPPHRTVPYGVLLLIMLMDIMILGMCQHYWKV